MANGLNCATDLTNCGLYLKQDGFVWVGRHIKPGTTEPLTRSEARQLSADGLSIVSLWTHRAPQSGSYFTAEAGTADGNGAAAAARTIGQPVATPIYFGVNYDASDADLQSIADYFASLQSIVRAAGYDAGVYGSGRVCERLLLSGYVSRTWLAQASGWAGYEAWSQKANIVQGTATAVAGVAVDLDQSHYDAGGWKILIGRKT